MRSEYDKFCQPELEEDEMAHISAMKAHRLKARRFKKSPCLICGTIENIQCAHVYPVSEFALLVEPGEIPLISLCKNHHDLQEAVAKLYIKGWNWKEHGTYLKLEPRAKQIIGELTNKMAAKFEEIMGKPPFECDPISMQTSGRWRVIYKKPTE